MRFPKPKTTEEKLIPHLLYHHKYTINHQVSLILLLKYLSTPIKCLVIPKVNTLTLTLSIFIWVTGMAYIDLIPGLWLSPTHPPQCCQRVRSINHT